MSEGGGEQLLQASTDEGVLLLASFRLAPLALLTRSMRSLLVGRPREREREPACSILDRAFD